MPKESASSTAFPRGLDDLIDTTRCPACFTPLRSTTCHNCGLDLSQPGAAELANTSKQAAELLRRRDELIGQLRQQVPDASAPAPASPGATPPPVSTPAPGSAPVQVPAAAAAAPASPAPAGPAEPRRHLGVQVILLIVGVALLSIGAIFFLVYAFITFGLVWRSVIIGAVTVAAFAGASLLRRRKLGATAEAIAALAVVLVYLDAFAVRANDLFGAAAADALVYWGITLLVSAVGFVLWHRLSRLRLPSIVGFAAFPIGAALLAAGLTEGLDTPERVFVGFAGAALGGLVHVVARGLGTGHALERLLVLSLGAAGLAGAGITANWLRPDLDWGAAVGLGIVAVLALAHVLVLLRTEGPRVLIAIVAIIGTIAASTAVLSAAVRMPDSGFTRVAPLVAAAVIALVLEFAQRRSTAEPARTPSLVAVWTAVGIGALTAVPAVFIAAVGVFEFAALPLTSGFWSVLGTERIRPGETGSSAVLALAVVVALTAAAWALNSTLAKRRYLVLTATAVVLVLAVPLVGVLWAATTCWLAIAGFAVILFVVGRGSGQGMRLLLAGTGVAALALGYAASWASLDTWWLGSLAAIAALIALRLGVGSTAIRAGLLGTALVLLGIAAGAGAWRLNEVVTGGAGRATEAVHGVLALAVLVLALAALVRRPLSSLDTRVAFWLAGAAAVVAAPLAWLLADGRDRLVAPDPVATAALGSALVGALVLWSVLPRARAFGVEAIAASLAVAPAGAMALHWLARAAGLDESVVALAPVVAALIVAAEALVTDAPALRAARDAGGAVVTVAVIGWALVSSDAAWLVLVLGAVTVLLFAVSRDGLFGSASPRKHLGWVALALATAGLWTRLALSEVVQLAAYVLPLAGALLLVALLAWRAARPEPSRTAPYIALGGLLVAGVPLAVDSFDGDHLVRTIVVAAVAAVLALAGSFTRARAELRPYLDAAAFAGGLTLLLTVTVHASGMLARGQREDATIDVWLAAALIVIVVAALGQQRLEGRTRAIVGQVVFGVALAAVTVVELASIELDTLGTARAVITIAVLGAVHVAAVTAHRAPLSRLIGWLALALAAIVALFAILGTAADPLELATVPLAAALLIAGAVRMRSTAAARSWAWLAPGILVLLVPSLLATFTEDTAWRLVLLGLACVAAIVVGALARLQAPLILGSVIVLIHAIRTFAPQLRAVYESTEWWVWAVVGGAIILFLGFTLERRIRNLKAVAARVSALR